jgi:hypothetical protein
LAVLLVSRQSYFDQDVGKIYLQSVWAAPWKDDVEPAVAYSTSLSA